MNFKRNTENLAACELKLAQIEVGNGALLNEFRQGTQHIFLSLPEAWISNLDTIALSKHISRLALIRSYITAGLDADICGIKDEEASTNERIELIAREA